LRVAACEERLGLTHSTRYNWIEFNRGDRSIPVADKANAMTADIINLRNARKAKQKADKEKQSAENRVVFGRTKADRTATAALIKLDKSRLDGAKRSNPDPDDDLDPGSVS
jgi:hypothetical protein